MAGPLPLTFAHLWSLKCTSVAWYQTAMCIYIARSSVCAHGGGVWWSSINPQDAHYTCAMCTYWSWFPLVGGGRGWRDSFVYMYKAHLRWSYMYIYQFLSSFLLRLSTVALPWGRCWTGTGWQLPSTTSPSRNHLTGRFSVRRHWTGRSWSTSRRPLRTSTTLSLSMVHMLVSAST